MPLYEFSCTNCNVDVELLIRGDEKPACPKCGKIKLQRKLSMIATPSSGQGSGPEPCAKPQCFEGG